MAMGGKPLAALIVGKKLPAGPPSTPGGAQGTAPSSELDVASDLLSAIEAKDPQAVADAMHAFCALHDEPDGDEAPPPE